MTSAIYVQTRKEIRALLPWAVGVGLATVTAASWAGRQDWMDSRYDQRTWALVVYAVGLLAVAALSMGQEMTHRTLPSLLMQPVDRRRVLWTKMVVLVAIASALGLIGELMMPHIDTWAGGGPRLLLVWGPPIVAVGLVPLLTLLTRKPLGGVVFAVVIPGVILVVTEWLYPALDQAGAMTIAWYGTIVASASGLAALAYAFPRVETPGDDASSGFWPRWQTANPDATFQAVARPAPVRRAWVWLAFKNELRLQQLTMVVSALFVLLGGVIVVLERMGLPYAGPSAGAPGVGALVALHGIFIAVIAGSRASAEERHLGVVAMQTLQPKPAWQSWMVKVAVTLGLTLALSVALPWIFRFVEADSYRSYHYNFSPATNWFGLEREYFAAVLFAAVAALYVSSLNSNSLWALLACFPTGVAIFFFTITVVAPVRLWLVRLYFSGLETLVTPAMQTNYRDQAWRIYFAKLRLLDTVERDLLIILGLGLSVLLLSLASRNHRSLERGRTLVVRQMGTIALYLGAAAALFVAAARLVLWLG